MELLKEEVEINETSSSKKEEENSLEEIYRSSQVNNSKNTLARLFFQHFQLLNRKNISQHFLLKEDEKLLANLKKLDTTSSKMIQKIPLLYLKKIESSTFEINYMEDDLFNGFLSSLGHNLDKNSLSLGKLIISYLF